MIINFFYDKKEYISKINSLIKNDSYVLWIEDFLVMNEYLTNQAEYYSYKEISLLDIDNMNNLKDFYNILNSYAKDIGFKPYNYEGVDYYLFKYNGMGYKIMCCDKSLFMCYKLNIYDYEYFFDYNEIRNNILLKKYN